MDKEGDGMQTEYRREMNHSYLVLKSETGGYAENYEAKMLLHNSIKGLLPCALRTIDGEPYFYYDVTSKQSIFSLFENKKFKYEDLASIFRAAADTMEGLEGYLLGSETLLLNPRYIYWDSENHSAVFCCCPRADTKEDMCTLTEYILPKIDHKDAEAVVLGYGIYRESMEENSNAEQIRRELEKCGKAESETNSEKSSKSRRQEETHSFEEERAITSEDEQERQKALDAFFEEEEEVEEKRPVWGLIGCVMTLAALAVCIYIILHYRMATPGQTAAGIIILAILGGTGAFLLYIRRIRGRKSQDKRELDKLESWGMEKYGEYHDEKGRSENWEKGQSENWENGQSENWEKGQSENWEKNRAESREKGQAGNREKGQAENWDKGQTGNWEKDQVKDQELQDQECGPTVLLTPSESQKDLPYLHIEGENEWDAVLAKGAELIGKMASSVDICLSHPAVSRIHGKVRRGDKACYLMDLNSRNGTYLNGILLEPEQEYLLQNNDIIYVAGTKMIYHAPPETENSYEKMT